MKRKSEMYVKIIRGGKRIWCKVIKISRHDNITAYVLTDMSHRKFGSVIKFPVSEVIAFTTQSLAGLGSPYVPAAESCAILDTIVPDSMDYETHISVRKVQDCLLYTSDAADE